MVNLELYRVFYVVANCGSLTKAAQELYISQPAVSQSIKQLENQIGGRLFVRTSKGMELTYEGKMIYGYVEEAYKLFDLVESKFPQIKKLALGEIRIGASDTLTKHYLFPYIKSFSQRYPDISIKLTNRTTEETLGLLRNGKVDIAFVNLPIEETSYFEVKECISLHDVFVTGKRYMDEFSSGISYAELNRYPVILLERASNSRVRLDRVLEGKGVSLTPSLELGSLESTVDFARAGLGITCVPREYIKDELDSGELFEIKLPEPLPERAVGMVKLRDVPLTFAAQQFIMSLEGREE